MPREERVERVSEPTTGSEWIEVGNLSIPTDLEPASWCIAQEAETPGHSLVAQAVSHCSLERGGTEDRETKAVTQAQ